MDKIKSIKFKSLDVFYSDELSGGGQKFYYQICNFIDKAFCGHQFFNSHKIIPITPRRIFEFCSGPGFLAFNLLSRGICESICLSDINPKAGEMVERTISHNKLENRAKFYLSNVLNDIPNNEKWDLVIANPPHFNNKSRIAQHISYIGNKSELIWKDSNWLIHSKFYADVDKFLNPGASMIMFENAQFSSATDWLDMIEDKFNIVTIQVIEPIFYIMWLVKS